MLVYCLETSPDSTHNDQLDVTVDAGLPDITGRFGNCIAQPGLTHFTSATGAFYSKGADEGQALFRIISTAADRKSTGDGISFQASRSNAIYGKSTTVQPAAIKTTMWKRIA